MGTCDTYDIHDFGKGPVQIRCTMVGPHLYHQCLVPIGSNTDNKPDVTHRNIFDSEE